MPITLLIQKFGYLALFIGTILEGETILVAAGFAAHRGFLNLVVVWAIAFSGSVIGDQIFFYIGRFKGKAFLAKKLSWKLQVDRVNKYISRYQNSLILFFRFFYGMRTIVPFALGLGNIKISKFIILNALGAAVWAICVGTAGYLFGSVLAGLLGDLRHLELHIMAAILLGGMLLWLVRLYIKRRKLSKSRPT